jgi:inositol phosphorylceramide mannosyltransferase catalytic subunit
MQSRTDLWMYLMLFKFGGVYASMDATCELPLQKLIRADDDMLVGHQPVLTSRVLQRQVGVKHHTWSFQHWTLASAPGHPVLRFMIDYITQNRHRIFSREGADMDALLRSGAAP